MKKLYLHCEINYILKRIQIKLKNKQKKETKIFLNFTNKKLLALNLLYTEHNIILKIIRF